MTIVMGLDQHRAQITAEWIDTATGEISRSRVAPAHRESVRRFLARFEGRELEVALEATARSRIGPARAKARRAVRLCVPHGCDDSGSLKSQPKLVRRMNCELPELPP